MNWVNEAWEDIQNWNENWAWMCQDFTLQTVAGQRIYQTDQIAADFGRWHEESLRCYKTAYGANNEQFLAFMQYADFRNSYMFGAMNNSAGRPMVFSERPRDKALLLGPVPDDAFTIYGEYQARATRMANNLDKPGNGTFPDQFHMIIVHRAVMKYSEFEGAGPLYGAAQANFKQVMGGLEKSQLEEITVGRALA
ncbi:hypothetical protein [Undibacterium sp.]|uniref:phage adaptor protein n=1 Tax=Undibacterium sp. TaxID=1914977 RepID=UPI00374D7F26